MIIRAFNQTIFKSANNYQFASAAAAAVDYYSLLGVDRGATRRQIEQAFSKLTRNVNPDNNSALFTRLTEALVILSDGKARDAYDSLLKVRKFSYINEPETKPVVNSYIADRKAQKNKQFAKRYNIDKFGRYKGGLPNRTSMKRGRALGQIGVMHSQGRQIDVNKFPQYPRVDTHVAESFKNYHQDERQVRAVRKPWITFEVDYKFFTFRNILNKLSLVKYAIFIFFIVPSLSIYFFSQSKRQHVLYKSLQQHDQEEKRLKKLQQQAKKKEAKQKEQAKKLEQQAKQKEQAENKSS